MVLKWSEGFGLTEASIMVFEDIDLNEERALMPQGIFMRMLAYCEKILKEKKRCLSHQT
jgi:hypothetical protein